MQGQAHEDKWYRSAMVWVLVAVLLVSLVLWVIGRKDILEYFKEPFVVAIVAGFIIYLTVDRWRAMEATIRDIQQRAEQLQRTAENTATKRATEIAEQVVVTMQETAKSFEAKVDRIEQSHPWLKAKHIPSSHLEPLFHKINAMPASGEEGTQEARRIVETVLSEDAYEGNPNDYHNFAVFAAQDLQDDLLAIQIHERYWQRVQSGALPRNLDVLADALEVYTRAEKLEEARKFAELVRTALLGKSPDPSRCLRWRPWVYLALYQRALGHYDEARKLLVDAREVLVNRESKGHVVRTLGSLAQDQGQLEDAERAMKESLELYPGLIPTSLRLARLYCGAGRTNEAIGTLQQAISQSNLDRNFEDQVGQAHDFLGRLFFDTGKLGEAGRHARIALRYGQLAFSSHVPLELPGDREEATRLEGINVVLSAAEELLEESQFRALASAVQQRVSAGDTRVPDGTAQSQHA